MEITKKLLLDELANVQIIGLGESAHGSSTLEKFRLNLSIELINHFNIKKVFVEAYADIIERITNTRNIRNYFLDLYSVQQTEEVFKTLKSMISNNIELIGIDYEKEQKQDLKKSSLKNMLDRRDKDMSHQILINTKNNEKVLVLAHNSHLANNQKDKTMGHFLKQKTKYISIAQSFFKGNVYAKDMSDGSYKSMKAPLIDSSFEEYFMSSQNKKYIVKKQVDESKYLRNIGYYLSDTTNVFQISLRDYKFDYLIAHNKSESSLPAV